MAQTPDIAFLKLTRKRGTVEVVSTDAGWSITGRGKTTMRMTIPRCACLKHVCETIHVGWGSSSTRTPTIAHHGDNDGHGNNHCHKGHVDRVLKIIDLIAKTYGPAAK